MKTKFNIIHKQNVSSTNELAKKMLQSMNTEDFTVISASKQVSGKGQRGNLWHSEANKNLLFSIITFPSFLKATEQFYLSKVISLGIIEYLKTKGKYFKIKWPNDIYYKNKKICGILIENSISGSSIKNSVIGIGININQTSFPEELGFATSLSLINNKEYQLKKELDKLLSYIYESYKNLKILSSNDIDRFYHTNLYKINELSEFRDKSGVFKGKITGTQPEGRLIIETYKNEIRTYDFKEVEFL